MTILVIIVLIVLQLFIFAFFTNCAFNCAFKGASVLSWISLGVFVLMFCLMITSGISHSLDMEVFKNEYDLVIYELDKPSNYDKDGYLKSDIEFNIIDKVNAINNTIQNTKEHQKHFCYIRFIANIIHDEDFYENEDLSSYPTIDWRNYKKDIQK